MKNYYHVDVTSLDQAVQLLDKYGTSAVVIAGGTEEITTMKESSLPSNQLATYVINLKTITPALNTITTDSAGLHVGPLTTLAAVAASSTVSQSWPALAQAALSVATPNIRNVGTIGGNISQDVWCWYYRYEHNLFNCLRKGGSVCYAASGNNTYHSIFGGPKGCYSVHPSDTGVALLALGGSVVTTQRTIPMNQFFYAFAPGNVLNADEIIKDIVVPTPPTGNGQVYLKYRARKGFDFATSSVGLVVAPSTGTVSTARVWLGGVAPAPVEAKGAEAALTGNALSATVAAAAGAAAVTNPQAAAMTDNNYKIALTTGMVKKAILSLLPQS